MKLPEPVILPAANVVGDEALDALKTLGHVIHYHQLKSAGPTSKLSKEETKEYFDTLHLLIPAYEGLREKLGWEVFSPYSLANRFSEDWKKS
jgi:hypothetical protein